MPQVECKQKQHISQQPDLADPNVDYLFDQMVSKLRSTYYALCGTHLH